MHFTNISNDLWSDLKYTEENRSFLVSNSVITMFQAQLLALAVRSYSATGVKLQ